MRSGASIALSLAFIGSACGGSAGPAAERPLAVSSPSATAPATLAPTPAPTPVPTPASTPEPNWDELPAAAHDIVPLTGQLVMVEAAIRDPKFTGKKLVWMGHLQQLVYSRLRDFPEWREPVIAALPTEQQEIVRATLEAGKQLRRLGGPIPKTLPDWKILEPAPLEDLLGYYKKAEAEFGVPWYYLAAINLVETRMGRIHGVSYAGAQGPMQFMPPTWKAYGGGGDVYNPHDAIMGAARYLKASGAPGDMAKALWHYNHHDAYVAAITMYGDVMKADPNAFRGYYGWQVYYGTVDGTIHLPVGWTKPATP